MEEETKKKKKKIISGNLNTIKIKAVIPDAAINLARLSELCRKTDELIKEAERMGGGSQRNRI